MAVNIDDLLSLDKLFIDKDNDFKKYIQNAILNAWDDNTVFSKSSNSSLNDLSWLEIPEALMFAFTNDFGKDSFNRSDIEELIGVKTSHNDMLKIIEEREPLGKFYEFDNNIWVGVDNQTGDAWTEDFTNFDDMAHWMINSDSSIDFKNEIERIDDLIEDYIISNNGKCPGFISSTITSNDKAISNLVNIMRMDYPLDWVDPYLSKIYDDGAVDAIISNSKYLWSESPIFESDLDANIKATELNIINGCYNFAGWEDLYSTNDSALRDTLDILSDNGIIANTEYNNSILEDLGLTKDILSIFVVNNDKDISIDPNSIKTYDISNFSENHKSFMNYCNDKVKALDFTEDIFGNKYPTILKCKINDFEDCSVVYVKDKSDSLCYIDKDKQLHIDSNLAPDILAAQMLFTDIDSNYLSSLNDHWSGLMMDEVIDIYNNRSLIKDNIINGKEK